MSVLPMPLNYFFWLLAAFTLLFFPTNAVTAADEPPAAAEEIEAEEIEAAPEDAEIEVIAEEDEEDDTPGKPATLSLKAEGAGPYKTFADGGLGPDLWRNTKRASAVFLINTMPASSLSPTMQKLIFGILLTEADLSLMKDNGPVPVDGGDLLSARLEKLIEGGAYRRALDLYSSLGLENAPKDVVRAGVTAMLFSGEKSLACLELNTVKNRFAEDDFFKTIAAYCDATLSDTPSPASLETLNNSPHKILAKLATQKDLTVLYKHEDFSKYSRIEKAMIAAEKRLRLPEGEHDFSKLPASDVQIISKIPGLSEKEKFLLDVRAVEWGLLNDAEFKKSVLSAVNLDIRKDPALAVPEGKEDWEQLPFYLQIAINKNDPKEKWAYLRQALPMAETYGVAALRPLGEMLYKAQPENPSFKEMRLAAEVMGSAGFPLSEPWIREIEKYSPKESEIKSYAQLQAVVILSKNERKVSENIDKFKSMAAAPGVKNLALASYIIENIDKSGSPAHNADEIYDNELDLTFQRDYVMPSMEVWNRLQDTPKQGHIGETVLLITAALRGTSPENTYPALFHDVLMSLKRVGLTDTSEDLAIEAVLGSSDD